MNWIYLFSAIVLEVAGTLSLKLSDGLARRGPVLLMILTYGLSFFAFSHALKHMEVGTAYAIFSALSLLNWKYLLAGFLLFRLFDIWKPFPIRKLEKLRGGWGIMADDWLAGVYAAILLKVALHFSLL